MISSKLEEITSEQITDRIVVKKSDALVNVCSEWNSASQMFCHTLQSLADQYSDKVDFFSLNYI